MSKFWLAAIPLIVVWLIAIRLSVGSFYSLLAAIPVPAQSPAVAAQTADSPLQHSVAPAIETPPSPERMEYTARAEEAPSSDATAVTTDPGHSGLTAEQIEERLGGIYDPHIRSLLISAIED